MSNIIRLARTIEGLTRGDVSKADKLAELKELYKDGVITLDEALDLVHEYIA